MDKRVLITDTLPEGGLALLRQRYEVDSRPGISSQELAEIISGYDALIVRSSTQVTAEVLSRADRLEVIGRAGTGVDNIDLEAATREGILVVNAPTSNTVSAAEHTLALMLSLARKIIPADRSVRGGKWERSRFMGSELRGKTLGLVGLGRVGTAVATRAAALEMRILAYDPFISPERAAYLHVLLVTLEELLQRSDYVSLHVPSSPATRGMIGERELALMKPTAYLINVARGDLVQEEALISALASGAIAGAALDVYPDEPHVSEALRRCDRVILTPHLGASTSEAQNAAALEVAEQIAEVLAGRSPRYPVNAIPLSDEEREALAPYLDLIERLGRLYAQTTPDNTLRLELVYAGEVTEYPTSVLTDAFLVGLLSGVSQEPVNMVNARVLARERGLGITETRTDEAAGFSNLIKVRAETTKGTFELAGTLMRNRPHIVRLGEFWYDFIPEGILLITEHREQAGVIGEMGTILGRHNISISFVQVGRKERQGYGLMVLGLDDPLSDEIMAEIMGMSSMRSARMVTL